MPGDQGLGNSLTNGVYLRDITTSVGTDADVDVGELVWSQQQNRLENLESERFRLNQAQGLTVDFNQTLSVSNVGNSNWGFLIQQKKLLINYYSRKIIIQHQLLLINYEWCSRYFRILHALLLIPIEIILNLQISIYLLMLACNQYIPCGQKFGLIFFCYPCRQSFVC